MFNEKMERARLGEEGTGSAYFCTVCPATRTTARTKLGSFSMTTTIEDIEERANIRLQNPDSVSQKALKRACKGVKTMPLMKDVGIGYEPLHADLSWVRFVLNIIAVEK